MATTKSSNPPAVRMNKQATAAVLPEDVLELARDAVTEVHGLALAALIIDNEEAGQPGLELSAAIRHMLRRITVVSDEVLYPLIQTGDEGAYDADDFERMKKIMGKEEFGTEARHG